VFFSNTSDILYNRLC